MMLSKADIANLALSHLGSGLEIANLDTESSPEARALRRFWPTALKEVLRDFDWPFSTKLLRLAKVGSREESPETWIYEYEFAYLYPPDCLNLRKILSGVRRETEEAAIPYRMVHGETGQLILTDKEDAIAEYSVDLTNTKLFPPDFSMALSFLLASYAAPRITAGDPAKLGERAIQFYSFQIQKAQASARNEERRDLPPEAEMIRARG